MEHARRGDTVWGEELSLNKELMDHPAHWWRACVCAKTGWITLHDIALHDMTLRYLHPKPRNPTRSDVEAKGRNRGALEAGKKESFTLSPWSSTTTTTPITHITLRASKTQEADASSYKPKDREQGALDAGREEGLDITSRHYCIAFTLILS